MNEAAAAAPTPLDARDIAAMLPHRFPFLLIDRVVAFEHIKRRALKPMTDWLDLNSGITRTTPTDLVRH